MVLNGHLIFSLYATFINHVALLQIVHRDQASNQILRSNLLLVVVQRMSFIPLKNEDYAQFSLFTN